MRITKYLLGAFAAALALTGCDSIKEDDRYIDVPAPEVNRKVLVEDFTGQMCTNCPKAHLMIESLEEQYGDAFIAVSIHSGAQSIAIDNRRYLGLATPLGNTYDEAAGVAVHGYPSIIVDGITSKVYLGTGSEWVDAVRRSLETTTCVTIECEANVVDREDGTKAIDIHSLVTSTDNYVGKLQLWIVEDGIVAPQMGVDGQPGFDRTYVHNNVFRAAVNGDWGTDITVAPYENVAGDYTYPIATDWEKTWNLDNLRIVAFVYNSAAGVEQAERCKVSNPGGNQQ